MDGHLLSYQYYHVILHVIRLFLVVLFDDSMGITFINHVGTFARVTNLRYISNVNLNLHLLLIFMISILNTI